MKKYFYPCIYIGCLGIQLIYLSACRKSENIKSSAVKPEKVLLDNDGFVNTNRVTIVHLYKDTVYTLKDPFVRQAGEQLIVDAGTLIKVQVEGQPPAITVEPGGIIQAIGTRDAPIVFTSNANPGSQYKNWGGIIIRGKSTDNANPPSSGTDNADFSGAMTYVRIEFAQLTLTAVGSNTILENIMVSYTNIMGQSLPTPSFEIDGGTFNARNLVSYACGGPADLYITRGYSGKMQNILALRHPFFGSRGNTPARTLAGIYIGNNQGNPVSAKPNTNPVLSNITLIGPNGQNGSPADYSDTVAVRSAALVTTGNSFFQLRNCLLLAYPEGGWYLDDSLTADHIRYGKAEVAYSIVQSIDSGRAFFLAPASYTPFASTDFKDFVLAPPFDNRLFANAADFALADPFNYNAPDPSPQPGSPVLQGANFDGPLFNDAFFNKGTQLGALGADNWLRGWTNFTPLKTNYNFSQ